MALHRYWDRGFWDEVDSDRPHSSGAHAVASTLPTRTNHDTALRARVQGQFVIEGGAALSPPPRIVAALRFILMITFGEDHTPYVPSSVNGDERIMATCLLTPRVETLPTDQPFWTLIWDHEEIIDTQGMRKGNGTGLGPIVSAVVLAIDGAFVLDPAFGYNIGYRSSGVLSVLWGSTSGP